MARRPRRPRVTIRNTYNYRVQALPGGSVRLRSEPTVGGAVILCVVTFALLYCLVIGVGPLIDFFSNYLLMQPGNPYAAPVLELLPWTYLMILLGAGVAIILVWRVVIRSIWFELRDEM